MRPKRPIRAALIGAICLTAYLAAFWPFQGLGWNRFPMAIAYSVLLSFGTIGVIMDGSLGSLHRIHLAIWFCTTTMFFLALWLFANPIGVVAALFSCISVAFICWIALVSIRGWIKVFFW